MLYTVLCSLFVPLVFAGKEVILQLKPETLIDTIKALKSSTYFQTLINAFAHKTAEIFIQKLKEERLSLTSETDKPNSVFKPVPNLREKKLEKKSKTRGPVVPRPKDQEAMQPKIKIAREDTIYVASDEKKGENMVKFLKPPPPDGDNLEKESVLTDADTPVKKTDVVQNAFKINGKQFRRFDFFWR